ncbi:TPA: hypothetical protein NG675_004967 [Vibrio parahaemolyticus]|nr:hypothetical protein [Vibrio parahaemolyticus]HCE2814408.1 hypothetical protein [Vibrio parahaemolyticus]HCE2818703.1 hypothetical protein [Vibrio parahaemolyticus]HCG5303158.1 hypothetical protein [Vibrio parahaemolyticus]HCG5307351.1 hypothetical protein [Vibrio parahaemolyticus]
MKIIHIIAPFSLSNPSHKPKAAVVETNNGFLYARDHFKSPVDVLGYTNIWDSNIAVLVDDESVFKGSLPYHHSLPDMVQPIVFGDIFLVGDDGTNFIGLESDFITQFLERY